MSEGSSGARAVGGPVPPEVDCACTYCCAYYAEAEIVDFISVGGEPLCPRCGIDSVIRARECGGVLPDEAELRRQRAAGFCIPEDEPILPIRRIKWTEIFASMEARAAGGVGKLDEETCRAAMAEMAWMLGDVQESGEVDAEGTASPARGRDAGDDAAAPVRDVSAEAPDAPPGSRRD
jgi:hypothetical protein